jgi:hypothetical protein
MGLVGTLSCMWGLESVFGKKMIGLESALSKRWELKSALNKKRDMA